MAIVKVKVGAYCLALYEGAFYRARVQNVERVRDPRTCSEYTKVTVFYLDYGNQAEVPSTDIRAIPPDLLKIPFQVSEKVDLFFSWF